MAVNLNERLDYFGSTVNAAVRLQGHSGGGDVMINADLLADPAVKAIVERPDIQTERVRVELKGFEGTMKPAGSRYTRLRTRPVPVPVVRNLAGSFGGLAVNRRPALKRNIPLSTMNSPV